MSLWVNEQLYTYEHSMLLFIYTYCDALHIQRLWSDGAHEHVALLIMVHVITVTGATA